MNLTFNRNIKKNNNSSYTDPNTNTNTSLHILLPIEYSPVPFDFKTACANEQASRRDLYLSARVIYIAKSNIAATF